MRAGVLGAILIGSLASALVLEQNTRDGWQGLKNHIDFERSLDRSLEDAQLTPQERAHLYKIIDDESVHDSFSDDKRADERRVVLGSPVGLIALKHDGSRQILVRSPQMFCGGTGNCGVMVFIRQNGNLRLILTAEGKGLLAGYSSRQGFSDLVVPFHGSAFESSFSVYRWNGTEYKRIDCYIATSDPDHPEKAAVISDCPDLVR